MVDIVKPLVWGKGIDASPAPTSPCRRRGGWSRDRVSCWNSIDIGAGRWGYLPRAEIDVQELVGHARHVVAVDRRSTMAP